MNIAIYGAGAMGTVLGAFLTIGGEAVDLISRNSAHIEALKTKGATVKCVADGVEKTTPVSALLPEEMSKGYDVIFLMTKQSKNAETVEFLQDYLTSGGIICTTQNGLPEESVASVIGTDKTYGAAVSFGANFLGGGAVELTSSLAAMSMLCGGYHNDNSKNGLLAEILQKAGAVSGNPDFVKTTDNLQGARWSKLAINSAFSTLSTVTGWNFGQVAKGRKTKRLAVAILREAIAVANASGITLAPMQGRDMAKVFGGKGFFKTQIIYALLPVAMKKHALLYSGMLKDVESGKKCDVDFVCGALVKAGKAVGVETPVAESVVELVHGIENGLYEITPQNADFLL